MTSHVGRVSSGARQWFPLTALVALTVGMGVYAAWLQVRITVIEERLERAIRHAIYPPRQAGRRLVKARRD